MSDDDLPDPSSAAPPQAVERVAARSKNVSHAAPIVIWETTKRLVQVRPWFIQRTDHDELSIRIETFLKHKGPLGAVSLPEKTITLKEEAAARLVQAVRQLSAVARQDKDGSYLVVPVEGGVADVSKIDPVNAAKAIVAMLAEPDIVNHLSDLDLSAELVNAFRGAIRLKEARAAMAALRSHLADGVAEERVYQEWCERHSWAFGNAYVLRDDVRRVTEADDVDLLLPTTITGYRDVIELKRPDMKVLNHDADHGSYYWSAEVSKAIGQCHRYLDLMHARLEHGLTDHPEIVAYHPRATIVIGRSNDWSDPRRRALHGLNSRMPGITVLTYDHLVLQGDRMIEVLGAEHPPDVADDSDSWDWDDEAPF